jgi:hypothetical protein
MRFILCTLFLFFLFVPVVFSETMDDFYNAENMWDEHQVVKPQDYEQVIEALEDKKEQKEQKSWRKKLKKFGGGSTLHKEINPEKEISEIDCLNPEDSALINIPVNLLINNEFLERGFYKISGKVVENKFYVEFYQSQFLKGKIEVIETNEDFDEEDLNFAKIIPYNESFVKLIFGSLDFNAYAFIPYSQ